MLHREQMLIENIESCKAIPRMVNIDLLRKLLT
jgi:hypothetical protein